MHAIGQEHTILTSAKPSQKEVYRGAFFYSQQKTRDQMGQ